MLLHVFLFTVAALGGALNAVAGGGSFLALPALIYAGVGPVAASATSTLAMWPASVASAVAYRREVVAVKGWLAWLGGISVAGGLLGGKLLVKTSDAWFLMLLPWLMLAAVATFTFGGRITDVVRRRAARRTDTDVARRHGACAAPLANTPIWILVLQLGIAIYGGYFGGGMGIMMLAALSLAGMTNIHEMNGLKIMLAVAVNGVALAAFIVDGLVAWGPGVVMIAGGVSGGYLGAALAPRFDAGSVRRFVVVVGWLMTVYFFLR